jgi:hypothetical protein
MGVGAMSMIQLMLAIVYPWIGIPIIFVCLWWLVKQPFKVRFFEEEIRVFYFRRKRHLAYQQIEYLRFVIPPKSKPTLSLKITGERKIIVFEYGTREDLAAIFNLFRSKNIRIKDEDGRSRGFVELKDGIYKVKPSLWK